MRSRTISSPSTRRSTHFQSVSSPQLTMAAFSPSTASSSVAASRTVASTVRSFASTANGAPSPANASTVPDPSSAMLMSRARSIVAAVPPLGNARTRKRWGTNASGRSSKRTSCPPRTCVVIPRSLQRSSVAAHTSRKPAASAALIQGRCWRGDFGTVYSSSWRRYSPAGAPPFRGSLAAWIRFPRIRIACTLPISSAASSVCPRSASPSSTAGG